VPTGTFLYNPPSDSNPADTSTTSAIRVTFTITDDDKRTNTNVEIQLIGSDNQLLFDTYFGDPDGNIFNNQLVQQVYNQPCVQTYDTAADNYSFSGTLCPDANMSWPSGGVSQSYQLNLGSPLLVHDLATTQIVVIGSNFAFDCSFLGCIGHDKFNGSVQVASVGSDGATRLVLSVQSGNGDDSTHWDESYPSHGWMMHDPLTETVLPQPWTP